MKIALIRREYITHLDGVNRFIALLAEGLRKLGHEVEIFSWCYRGVYRERLEEWFREIHGLDTAIPIHTLREGPCGGDPWARMALDWFFKGSRMLRNSGFDVVIVNGIVPLRFKPKVAVNHGITLNAGKLYLFAAKWLYKHYDKVICVSHRLREEVRNILGINCEIIPLPMKLELYKPRSINERENMVIHIGARPVKNPHISIEAIKMLRKRSYGIKLIVIGAPSDIPKDEGVEYRYGLTENEKNELLCKAKALILPSSYETFSYVVLEAMACGTPVVVSNAVPEEVVINNFNGIRVKSYSPEDYANVLEKVLACEELWLKLSRNGLEFVKQFNYTEIAKKYANLVSDLL
jgi:glycosyltransferase involved in cell wall biosynthesis